MRLIFLLPLLILFMGCDQAMKEAYAPTNPPKTPKKDFNGEMIKGTFKAQGPLMFLWPVDSWNPEGTALLPMSLEQKAESRKKIGLYRVQREIFEAQATKKAEEIAIFYGEKKVELEAQFASQACYSYCDPDLDIFCEPDDDSVTEVDEWLCSEDSDPTAGEGDCADESLLQKISLCQLNQKERSGLKQKQKEETLAAYAPAKEAAEKLLVEIGDRNFFSDLSRLDVKYDPRIPIPVEITVGYYDMIFSNSGVSSHLPLTNINLDLADGFLTFDIAAIDIPSSTVVDGTLSFDLEFRFVDGNVSLDGDVILRRPGYEDRVGRLSAPGTITN